MSTLQKSRVGDKRVDKDYSVFMTRLRNIVKLGFNMAKLSYIYKQ